MPTPSGLCDCDPANLCPECVDRALLWHSGVARRWGEVWAERVHRRVQSKQPWPSYDESERVRQIARRKVGELSHDARVVDMLARKCADEAQKRWGELTLSR